MSRMNLDTIEDLFRRFREAHKAAEGGEKSLRYQERLLANMRNPRYIHDATAVERARALRDAAAAERGRARAVALDVQAAAVSALAQLRENDCGGLMDLLRLRRAAITARSAGRLGALLGFASFAAVLTSGWFAVKQPIRYALIAGAVAFFLLLLRLGLQSRKESALNLVTAEMLAHTQAFRTAAEEPIAQAPAGQDRAVAAAPGASAEEVLRTRDYREFEQKYAASLQMKDRGALASALRTRREATEGVRLVPALYSLGKHHEMILQYNHIGRGMDARASALESLRHEDALRDISRALQPRLKFDCYQEVLEYLVAASTSYEEVLDYANKLKTAFPSDANLRRMRELEQAQRQHGRWYTTHRAILASFYSRVSPELDKGRHAAGVALIDVILANAEASGYKLEYEEYFDLLDDMCALALQVLTQHAQHRPGAAAGPEDGTELGCILEKPLEYLSKSYHDCAAKEKRLFDGYVNAMSRIPWIGMVAAWRDLNEAAH